MPVDRPYRSWAVTRMHPLLIAGERPPSTLPPALSEVVDTDPVTLAVTWAGAMGPLRQVILERIRRVDRGAARYDGHGKKAAGHIARGIGVEIGHDLTGGEVHREFPRVRARSLRLVDGRA